MKAKLAERQPCAPVVLRGIPETRTSRANNKGQAFQAMDVRRGEELHRRSGGHSTCGRHRSGPASHARSVHERRLVGAHQTQPSPPRSGTTPIKDRKKRCHENHEDRSFTHCGPTSGSCKRRLSGGFRCNRFQLSLHVQRFSRLVVASQQGPCDTALNQPSGLRGIGNSEGLPIRITRLRKSRQNPERKPRSRQKLG